METRWLIIFLILVSLLAIFARYNYETEGTMTGKYVPLPPGMKTHEEIVAEREAEEAAKAAVGQVQQEEAMPTDMDGQAEAGETETETPETPFDITWLYYGFGGIVAAILIWFLWKTFAK